MSLKRREDSPDLNRSSCPLPIRDYPEIVMAHGGGGKLSAELIDRLFVPAFKNVHVAELSDSAVLDVDGQRLAFSTDSFVVRPLFFPGGNIGDLAVNGTVNDLAMSGAKPLFLSAGFVIEEGFSVATLAEIAETMSRAAARAGVQIVTGDTKVVEKGHGDGCYINTSGIGLLTNEPHITSKQARPNDVILLSGTMGDHGMAIMSVREGLEFEAEITSDTAPLNDLVRKMLLTCPDIRVLRDPTRGGVATSLNEIAKAANVGIEIDELSIPVNPIVQSACELLGLDPLYVANEGKLLAIVPAEASDATLATMQQHEFGAAARIIGHVTETHRKMVVVKTAIGATRIVTLPMGEQLPRIC